MITKPHEETWERNADINGGIENGAYPIARFTSSVADESPRPDWAEHNDARAQLAACAPEMARMLLDLESAGVQEDQVTMCCPVCGGGEPYAPPKHDKPTHRKACALVALLEKAGVR